ncbi:MAG: DUF502 domain-containing protein [Candidatus Omnitrophota bacterium]
MKRPTNRRYFLTGLLIVLPILATLYLCVSLFLFFDNILGRYISRVTEASVGFKIPGLGLLVFILLIFFTGLLAANFIGRGLLSFFEKFWLRFPVIKNVYPAAKQITHFLFSPDVKKGVRSVALIEYPRKGIYTLCFVTNKTGPYFEEKLGGEELYNILVPSVPSPLTGYYIMVPKKDVTLLDLSIEEAMKLIVSGGVLNPKDLTVLALPEA